MAAAPSTMANGSAKKSHSTESHNVIEYKSFVEFAQKNFMGGIPSHFSRKDIKHQLLKQTGDSDKRASIAVWKVILKFMGDVTDYKSITSSSKNNTQRSSGSVMKRLYRYFGISNDNDQNATNRNSVEEMDQNTLSADAMLVEALEKSFNKKKSGGTIKKLTATIAARVAKGAEKSDRSMIDLSPIEEMPMTTLDQVHFILGFGMLKPSLRDEIYCQVCKQLTKNPYKSSIARGWILLTLLTATFTPSPQVLHVVAKFLDEGNPSNSVKCKKNLQRALQNGTRNQPASYMEYEATLNKKSLELSITLMDGSNHQYAADHATTAQEITNDIADVLDIKETFGFSVFISIGSKVASLGNGRDHVFDAISQCEQLFREIDGKDGPAPWRLFYRKEMFSPWEGIMGDSVSTNLIFSQIGRGILLGEYMLETEVQIAQLAAQQYYVEYGADISEDGLSALLPSFVPKSAIEDDEDFIKMRKLVVRVHRKLFADNPNKSAERVKQEVVHLAKTRWPLSFSRYYDVTRVEGPQWPANNVTIAINWKGIYVMHQGELLREILYPELDSVSDGGDTEHIVMLMLVQGGAIKFVSSDAADIKYLMDYMLKGLKRRSSYAVAVQNYDATIPGELSLKVGDLIHLDSMAQDFYTKPDNRSKGTNQRSAEHGIIFTEHVYVLPVLEEPSESILNIFNNGKLRGTSQA